MPNTYNLLRFRTDFVKHASKDEKGDDVVTSEPTREFLGYQVVSAGGTEIGLFDMNGDPLDFGDEPYEADAEVVGRKRQNKVKAPAWAAKVFPE